MIIACAVAFLLLAVVNVWLSRALLYPPALFSLAWSGYMVALELSQGIYFPVAEGTLLLFLGGALAVSLGGAIALLVTSSADGGAAARARRQPAVVDRIIGLGVWLIVLTLPLRVLRLQQLSGGSLDLLSAQFWYLVRRASIEESDASAVTWLSLTDNLVLGALFLALAAVASDVEQRRMRLRTVVIVLLAVAYQVSTASRASGMTLVGGLIAIVWMSSGRWSMRSIVLGVVGAVAVFSFAAVFMGKGGRLDDTLVENVVGVAKASVLYAVGPLVAFDGAFQHPDSVPPVWSITYSVVQVANKLGAGIVLPSIHAVFTQVGPDAWMNAYTIYFAYVPDVGVPGALLLLVLVGGLLTLLFLAGRAGSPHARLLYATTVSGILMSGFAEYFFMGMSFYAKAVLFSLVVYGMPPLTIPRLRETRAVARAALPRARSLLIALAALGLAGCVEDPGTPAEPAAGATPTAVASMAPKAAAATPPASAREQLLQVGGALRIEPGAIDLQSGHAYWVRLPDAWLPVASDQDDPQRSTLVVEEDGVALAPGNTPLETIQKVGRGSFLHWGVWLYFSSSDNSDPRTNGRIYHAVLPRAE